MKIEHKKPIRVDPPSCPVGTILSFTKPAGNSYWLVIGKDRYLCLHDSENCIYGQINAGFSASKDWSIIPHTSVTLVIGE